MGSKLQAERLARRLRFPTGEKGCVYIAYPLSLTSNVYIYLEAARRAAGGGRGGGNPSEEG